MGTKEEIEQLERDSLVRQKIDKKIQHKNGFQKFLDFINPILVVIVAGFVGAALTNYYNEKQIELQNELEIIRIESERQKNLQRMESMANQNAIFDLTQSIYERYTRAMMLSVAINRYMKYPNPEIKGELLTRKQLYDRSLENWNIRLKTNLLVVRSLQDSINYTSLESKIENELSSKLRELDNILTNKYDLLLMNKKDKINYESGLINNILTEILRIAFFISEDLLDNHHDNKNLNKVINN